MEEPSSPIDWNLLDAELGDIEADHGDTRNDAVPEPVEAGLASVFGGGSMGPHMEREEAPAGRSGYFSDEERPRQRSNSGMGVFRDVVKDMIQQTSSSCQRKFPSGRPGRVQSFPSDSEVFSGLRIKDQVVSSAEINNTLSDMRFIKLPAIKTAMMCGKVGGSWATVGIVVEKGKPKVSAKGKSFAAWKLGTLEKTTVSILLFGAAYTEYEKEPLGATFAILSSGIRPDAKTNDPCLSVFTRDQLMKLGMSMDFAICSGTRKDGTACTMVLNRQSQGRYCRYHAFTGNAELRTSRPELNGVKLTLVGPGIQRGYPLKLPDSPIKDEVFKKPLTQVTASEMRDMLSDPEKMPAKSFSQGKRFLEVVAQRKSDPKESEKRGTKRLNTREAVKKEKRALPNEKKTNVTTSGLKPAPDKKSCKGKSKAGVGVMEIDTVEDDDDLELLAAFL